jgi:hypothetical protein
MLKNNINGVNESPQLNYVMMISETLVLQGDLLPLAEAFSCHKKGEYEKNSIIGVSGIMDNGIEAIGTGYGVKDEPPV